MVNNPLIDVYKTIIVSYFLYKDGKKAKSNGSRQCFQPKSPNQHSLSSLTNLSTSQVGLAWVPDFIKKN